MDVQHRQRETARGRNGMVATSQPLAVHAGVDVLKAGGTAVDAALAANATLAVVEPMSCGPGGDVFALVWDASARRLFGLNGSGRAPAAATIGAFRDRGLARIPSLGPLSWTVPGCVDGWFRLHERFGRLPWPALFEAAICAAGEGFLVTPVIAGMWRDAEPLLAVDPGSAATFLPDGRAPRAGETVRNPDLARSLRQIALDGPNAVYHGPIARELAASAERTGGLLAAGDLATHAAQWVEPLSLSFCGFEVWELPPNTQGVVVLEMLNILSGYDLVSLEPRSADYLHLWIEAKKLAYENRARWVGDPDMGGPWVTALLTPEHGERQRKRIDPHRATLGVPATEDPTRSCDTVYVTAVDRDRNACSLIQSVFHGFGSGITPEGLGFVMQNRGSLFALDPRHPNALRPGKRPFHTIIPAMVTQDGRPVFSFGVMGGDMQPQGQVQVLINVLVHGMDPQEAGDAPRVRHDGSSTPTGDAMHEGGVVHLEPAFGNEVAAALRRKGHRVETSEGGYGGYQGIWIDEETRTLLGGSESRKDGLALGY
ncbi:MAG: gamma-glutamyltransferase family protein [Candidatus Bipolaricaulota bacterium]|nr:gamma-glutamyltransferase family protein [Candidatus Bipolaricaulota bacterium]